MFHMVGTVSFLTPVPNGVTNSAGDMAKMLRDNYTMNWFGGRVLTHISAVASRATTIFLALLLPPSVLARATDLRSYRLGATAAWSEAVKPPTLDKYLALKQGKAELSDLLADPANDDISVFDLYNDTQEFNRNCVSSLTRPNTLQSLTKNYDAATHLRVGPG